MSESRWERRFGPGIAALIGILVIATATVAAAGEWPPPDCEAMGPARPVAGSAWFRLEPTLVDGARAGQRLTVGQGRGRRWALALDAESFATGPRAGLVVVGTDDGEHSTLSVIDASRGCRSALASTTDVVRSAVLAADGRTLFEHRVARTDRRDEGIWRRAADGVVDRVLPPPEDDPAFGRTWLTELHWSGRRLIVATCGQVACRFRELDPMSGAIRSFSDPSLGSLVGASGDDLIVRGACRGLPCPVRRVDLASGTVATLAASIGAAVLAVDRDGRTVVAMAPLDGDEMTVMRPDGTDLTAIDADPATPLAAPAGDLGIELPPGWVPVLGPDGPLAGRLDADLLRRLDEVRP